MRKFSTLVLVTLVVILAGVNVWAQTTQNAADAVAQSSATSSHFVATSPTNSAATQAIVNSLSILPDTDTIVYINPQRILNDLLPKFMPPKELEEMRKGFEQAKQMAGVDPTKVEYIVLATRFRKPTDNLNFQMPEFMIVTSGDFSAEALLAMARMASGGRLRDEKYGNKTIGLMTIDPLVKEAEKNPILKSFTEVGVVVLNGNTIAAGSPRYLKAAIDAGDGKERISVQTLNSLVRDPNALVSIAGTPWHSFAKSFGMLGTETNARAPKCDTRQGDFYMALTMDATNFMVRGFMNADNPDTAKIMSNLFSGFLRHATSSIKDPMIQPLLSGLGIVAEGDEVMFRADVPQQLVLDTIKKQMMQPKKEGTSMKPADVKVTKPTTKRTRTRRRG